MVNSSSTVEIMAPAGSFESLRAAIQGGANSVYFGIGQLNMRARSANNFVVPDLPEILSICKENQVRTYLTLNTVLYDHDMKLMKRIVDQAGDCGVSALIISDQAAIHYAHQKGLEIHLSTQLNISNIETVKFYANFADVIVLARELSLRQVKKIVNTIERDDVRGPSGELVQIEIFAHGALCMAISGKCYLSLHDQNASANRGACTQPCRKAYTVTEKESGHQLEIDNEYIMSPKDLCTIDFLDQILDTGVRVLKLEGRARSPEYVKTVTRCYREAVDSWKQGNYTAERVEEWKKQLETVYNRGFWDGYYLGRRLGEWSDSYGSEATKRKVYIGKNVNYFAHPKVAEFRMDAGKLSVGDEIIITGPTTGVVGSTIKELRVDGQPADKAQKGDLITFPIDDTIRGADRLYKMVNATNKKRS